MKKLLAFVLCLALMMTSLVFVSADADATLTVATVEGPFFAGEEVTIPVTITEWANAYATIELTFDYDETLLELDAIEASEDDFSGSMSASNTETNQFSLICNPSSDKSAKKLLGGEICVAYFVAAADITESIAINVTAAVKGYAQGKDDNWTQTKTLTVEINNGGINVETIGGECPHEGGTATCNAKAICDLCGEQYGELDVTNHAEGTEVRGSSDTYTGDIHCLGCGKMLEQGRPIESNDAVGTVIVSNTNGKQGDEVTVTVSLGENTALAAYDATLEFDKTALELVQMEKGDFCIAVNVANGKANGFNVENVIDKTLFSATFKILAQEGELEVGVSFTKAILSDLTPVTMNITKGIVTVEEEPNEDTVTMTVGTVDGPIYKGQEIEIPITISEWANGYATIEFAIDFDETLLEVDAIEISDKDFKGAMGAGNGNKFALLCNTNTLEQQQKTDGGEVCVIYFIAAADINEDVVVEIESIEVNGYVKGKTDNWTQYGLLSVETIDGGIKSDSDQGEDNDHDCAPVGDIQYDETNHWYNCVTVGCGVLVNVAPHEGGTATCNAKAECIVCGAEYGNVNANNHAGGTEILNASETYTGDIYCLGCNEVIRKGTTIISSYGVGYVTVSNATGKQGDEVTVTVSLGKYTTIAAYGAELVYDETVLQLVSMAEGYFCDAVNAANGRAIGIASKNVTSGSLFTATFKILKGTGPFTVDVEFDENSTANLAGESVTINVTPGTISVRCEHAWNNGEVTKEATCTEAGEKLFTCTKCKGTKTEAIAVLDHSWEVGVTKEPTCNEAGEKVYNCIGCGLTKSEAIPATGNHIGGTATCNAKAKCSICSKEYGKINANNHAGGTEIRNTSATYTGDIYCLGCNQIIVKGEAIVTDANVTIGTVEGPFKAGEEIIVPISVSNWANALSTIEFELSYDEYRLELVSIDLNDIDDFAIGLYNDNKFAAVFNPLNKEQANKINGGKICVARFKALTNINSFIAIDFVSLTVEGYTKGEKDNWLEYRLLNIESENGGIKVDNPKPEYAESVITIDTANNSEAVGNKISLPVTITEWANGYSVIEFEIDYDKTLLRLDSIEAAKDNFKGADFTFDGNKVRIVCNPTSKSEAEEFIGGEICIIHFTIIGDSEEDIDVTTENIKVYGYAKGAEDGWSVYRDLDTAAVEGGIRFGLLGDVNDDGKINAMDAMVVSQFYVELPVEINEAVADVNGDGKINAMDAMLISQYYVELIDKFPIEG